MKDYRSTRSKIFFLLLSLAALGAGCSAHAPIAPPVNTETSMGLVLLVPFQNMQRIYGDNESFTCPLSGNTYFIGQVAEGGDELMTEKLLAQLHRRGNIEILPPEQAQGAQAGLLRSSKTELSEVELLVESGRALKAGAVVFGRIYRFTERQGTPYAADKPASASFDILMISAEDGRLLWEGHFNETQRPLMDNLFKIQTFIQQKGRWLTVQELADIGLEQALRTFPLK
jgi:hypothetical protein